MKKEFQKMFTWKKGKKLKTSNVLQCNNKNDFTNQLLGVSFQNKH